MLDAYRWFVLIVATFGLIEATINVYDAWKSVQKFKEDDLSRPAREQMTTEFVLFWLHGVIVFFSVLSVAHVMGWMVISRTIFLVSSVFMTYRSLNARRVRRDWQREWEERYGNRDR